MNALTKLLDENDGKRVLVFAKTNRNADFIAVMLSEQRKLTTSIHGERLRRDKQLARKSFISGHHHILVATSAAVCGPGVRAQDRENRARRPQREAVSFFDIDHDAGLVDDLTRVLRQANQPLPDFFPVESAATMPD
ncbi:hypothetical protein MSG28_005377 [Choristoneura fumiferana]|uniref:Uncharacterized protein n=1 Tax=Choristoneura fumiferana TaxID=7141 RepID=A0ACC0JRC1_CHOFU|nr:hypothetical protein MSG28_005377 [Choristoneura fumiferana]